MSIQLTGRGSGLNVQDGNVRFQVLVVTKEFGNLNSQMEVNQLCTSSWRVDICWKIWLEKESSVLTLELKEPIAKLLYNPY
jgi:hypothetical protein